MPHRKPPPNRKIKTAKRRAMAQGLRAETLAAFYLRLKGYRILARNLRVAGGEVDMVARRGNVLVFVEVKYRPSLGAAQAVMHDAQWRRNMSAHDRRCNAITGVLTSSPWHRGSARGILKMPGARLFKCRFTLEPKADLPETAALSGTREEYK